MVKREVVADPEIDVHAPRPKRHKDGDVEPSMKQGGDVPEKGASSEREDEGGANVVDTAPSMDPEEVRKEGLKVLQVLKDAVNKEGRQISYDFLRLPSKRQFPDYYEIIKRPIALDDVKTQLESHAYPSLEALREDLETCFKNARKYNQRESVIWRDAKTLQKLANKEIDKIVRKGDDDDEGSDKEGGKKKEKGVNIHRLMKNRLIKLTEFADDNERRLSNDFMELPSKKKWAVYYKLIKQPICIEDIFKRIKRKEYHTISDFMNDVDLVFDNAMEFNEDHSPIWEDALVLKTYFHRLMTALPAKYNMNGADAHSSASPEVSHNRIKLKLPGHPTSLHIGGSDAAHGDESSTATVRLRVPGLGGSGSGASGGATVSSDKETKVTLAKKGKATSPAVPAASLPSATSIPYSSSASTSPPIVDAAAASASTSALAMPTPKSARAATHAHMKTATLGQIPSQHQQSSPYTPFHQYTAPNHIPPQNFYNPPAPTVSSQATGRSSATPAPVVPQPAITTARTDAPSPVPPVSAAGLYSVQLECCPSDKTEIRRRLAVLSSKAGVRNFALRVPITEPKLIIRSIKLALHDGDGEGGEGSDAEGDAKIVQTPTKKRGRGRPKKVVPIDQEVKPPEAQPERSSPAPAPAPAPSSNENKEKREWRFASSSEVEAKLDGQEMVPSTKDASTKPTVFVNGHTEPSPNRESSESPAKPEGEWTVEVTSGQHILEIGRKGNNVPWRVYLTVT